MIPKEPGYYHFRIDHEHTWEVVEVANDGYVYRCGCECSPHEEAAEAAEWGERIVLPEETD